MTSLKKMFKHSHTTAAGEADAYATRLAAYFEVEGVLIFEQSVSQQAASKAAADAARKVCEEYQQQLTDKYSPYGGGKPKGKGKGKGKNGKGKYKSPSLFFSPIQSGTTPVQRHSCSTSKTALTLQN